MIKIRFLLIFTLSTFVTINSLNAYQQVNDHKESYRNLEEIVDLVVAEYPIHDLKTSISVSIVQKDSVLLEKGYGFSSSGNPTIPGKTTFYTASTSKLIIATSLMILVERGEVNLNDPVDIHLPLIKIFNQFNEPLRVIHLITHTSGIDPYTIGIDAPWNGPEISLKEYFEKHPPRIVIQPGSQINYSNQGIALAGHLIEQVSGVTFEEFVQENIFKPIGMSRSTFEQPPIDSLLTDLAPQGFKKSRLIYSVGSMVTTASDMGKFIMSNFKSSERRILSEETLELMHSKQFSARNNMPGIALGFFETVINDQRVLFHTGSRDHLSILLLYPEREFGIYTVITGNLDGSLRYDLVNKIFDKYFPSIEPDKQTPSYTDIQNTDELVGYYRLNSMPGNSIEKIMAIVSDLEISKNRSGDLVFGNPGGQGGSANLVKVDELLFRTESEGFVSFERNRDGEIDQMFISMPMRDSVSLTKLKWFEKGKLHLILTGLSYLIMLFLLIIALILKIKKWVQRKKLPQKAKIEKRIWKLSLVTSFLFYLAPFSALLMAILSPEKHHYNKVPILYVMNSIFLTAGILSLLVIVLTILTYREPSISYKKNILYSVLSSVYGWMIIFMTYWNILGYQF